MGQLVTADDAGGAARVCRRRRWGQLVLCRRSCLQPTPMGQLVPAGDAEAGTAGTVGAAGTAGTRDAMEHHRQGMSTGPQPRRRPCDNTLDRCRKHPCRRSKPCRAGVHPSQSDCGREAPRVHLARNAQGRWETRMRPRLALARKHSMSLCACGGCSHSSLRDAARQVRSEIRGAHMQHRGCTAINASAR
jgi:hypothetical protein